jgi:hypothetical protein
MTTKAKSLLFWTVLVITAAIIFFSAQEFR